MTALQRSYCFTPTVLTTSPPDQELTNGIPFCHVRSLLTGKRLVSLPFSDHCQPLSAPEELFNVLTELLKLNKLKYIELRPIDLQAKPNLTQTGSYLFHALDLRPSLEAIYRRFHADCVRRKIRRAERDGLTVDSGNSESLLRDFYALQVITRKRHGIPPQPRHWFQNLMASLGDKAVIRVARLQERPVAAILTLQHKITSVYKYGCSDENFSNHGGMQLLFWREIEEAKAHGMESLDMGRCDLENTGLAIFKERLGAERREIHYYRYPAGKPGRSSSRMLSRLPKPILIALGRLLYRHIA